MTSAELEPEPLGNKKMGFFAASRGRAERCWESPGVAKPARQSQGNPDPKSTSLGLCGIKIGKDL